MISHSSSRFFLSILALATALAPSSCVVEADDSAGTEEDVSTNSEAIIGGVSVTAQYPEAATIAGIGGTLPVGALLGCSGTLIAPKVVLTAGHCVDGPKAWQVNVGAQSRITSSAATFDAKNDLSPNPAHHDVGLLFLDQAITLAAYPTIAQTAAPADAQVLNVGRVHNGPTNTLWGAVTTGLHDGAAIGFPYVYYTPNVLESGDSGGPDFLVGTHTIVAVNSFFKNVNGSDVGGLARVDLLYRWITQPVDDSSFFVRQVYLDVLGREPDQGGFAFWLNTLQSCNGAPACLDAARVGLARGLLESAESRTKYPELDPASAGYKGAYVTHCYTNFLRRSPAAAEYNFWLNFLSSTGDYSGVVRGFITSAEYRSRFGAP